MTVPTRVSYPGIKFWTSEDFDKWLLSPEGQVAVRGTVPYLEEENGTFVGASRVKAIKSFMRSAYTELANTKRAPRVWGELDTTTRQQFHESIEKVYPLFRFAENGWKLDRLARTTYPQWRSFHLNANLDRKSEEEKKLLKMKRKNTEEPELHWPTPTKIQRGEGII